MPAENIKFKISDKLFMLTGYFILPTLTGAGSRSKFVHINWLQIYEVHNIANVERKSPANTDIILFTLLFAVLSSLHPLYSLHHIPIIVQLLHILHTACTCTRTGLLFTNLLPVLSYSAWLGRGVVVPAASLLTHIAIVWGQLFILALGTSDLLHKYRVLHFGGNVMGLSLIHI